MGEHDFGRAGGVLRISAAIVLGVACVVASTSCASQPAPQTAEPAPVVAPQTVTPSPAPTPQHVEEPVAAAVRGNQPVVIEEGTNTASGARELAAVAAAERERRRQAGPATVVINNANLAEHATGKLTIVQGSGAPPPISPALAAAAKDERYWRARVRGLREEWAAAVESIGELETRAAGLRNRFYAQDDPYVRDGQIKPAWDRALESLDAAKQRAQSLEDQLGAVLEEGRQAGALPGWLRDGIELEPTERPYDPPERTVARDDGNLVREPEELGEPPHR
jgi:hypothetical protein